MPDVEVDRPEDDRDHRVGEHPQLGDDPDPQHRGEHRPGNPEHQQQRGDVADQQVLGHVRDEQLVGELVDRRAERDGEDEQARGEADPAPQGHRTALVGQPAGPHVVGRPGSSTRIGSPIEPVGNAAAVGIALRETMVSRARAPVAGAWELELAQRLDDQDDHDDHRDDGDEVDEDLEGLGFGAQRVDHRISRRYRT